MIVTVEKVTPGLVAWLERQHDDNERPLVVLAGSRRVAIRRADGAELTEREQAHVRGVLAAHAVKDL